VRAHSRRTAAVGARLVVTTVACQTFVRYYCLSQWLGVHSKMASRLAAVRVWDSCTQILKKSKHSRVINFNSTIRFCTLIVLVFVIVSNLIVASDPATLSGSVEMTENVVHPYRSH